MNTKTSQTSNRSYRPDIDGVRAIAILGVVLYHAGVPFVSGGFSGVDVFFVISGYLIGGHIFSEIRSGTFTFLHFYQRRAKRILPAFFLVVAFSLLIAVVLLSPFEAYIFAKSSLAALFSVSNVYFGMNASYFQPANDLKPLLMTWSLGIEEQFYVGIPLLMLLLDRLKRELLAPAILVICLLSFVYACIVLRRQPSAAFYSLPARTWELGAGVGLAVTELTGKRKLLSSIWSQVTGPVGLAMILAPMCLLNSATPFPGAYALPSVLGTAIVIASHPSWLNRNLLSLQPPVFIGRISYSWYLWHWPLLAFLHLAAAGRLPTHIAMLAVIASFLVAILSYYLVEGPFRRSVRPPLPLLFRYALVGLLFVAASSTLRLAHGFPQRYPDLTHDGDVGADPCVADYGVNEPQLSSRCYPTSDLRPSVVLWGDSHSSVLAETLRKISSNKGYGFIQLSKSSCLPLEGAALFIAQHPMVATECIHFNKEVSDLIVKDNRVRIVILTGRWAAPFYAENPDPLVSTLQLNDNQQYGDAVRNTFVQSLSASVIPLLRNGNRQVMVLNDVPNFAFDPLLRYRTARIPTRHAIAHWISAGSDDAGLAPAAFTSAADTTAELFRQSIAKLPGVQIIELKANLCNTRNLCAYMQGDELLYADPHHLTNEGAQFALRSFHLPELRPTAIRAVDEEKACKVGFPCNLNDAYATE